MDPTLREVDRTKYPELDGYSKADIWRDIGPGGLYLVSRLAKTLDLWPGAGNPADRVQASAQALHDRLSTCGQAQGLALTFPEAGSPTL